MVLELLYLLWHIRICIKKLYVIDCVVKNGVNFVKLGGYKFRFLKSNI